MPKILIVDEVASQQVFICRALQNAGYTVSLIHDGDEVMQNIELIKPNLIVLDVDMERMNGYELLWELRENEKTKQIPVVACSTKITNFEKNWSLDLGADAYVPKPIDAEHLVSIVQRLLKTQVQQLEATTAPKADTGHFFDMLDEMLEAEESINSSIAIADSTPSFRSYEIPADRSLHNDTGRFFDMLDEMLEAVESINSSIAAQIQHCQLGV